MNGENITTVSPEYEDCKRIAIDNDIPLKDVYEEAKKMADSILNKKTYD